VAPGTATLSVTSDLPARVSVDGLLLGGTPLRVKKPAGPHVITLTSTTLGESLTARVVASEGGTVSVHGEFTRPVPALRIR
jgi:hypothetical protein